jgi:succinate dehydrogenase / fumarate reductase iron-sulfur subunit
MQGTFTLKIYRGIPGNQYWEEFELKRSVDANVISSLMEIQKNPINKEGLPLPGSRAVWKRCVVLVRC